MSQIILCLWRINLKCDFSDTIFDVINEVKNYTKSYKESTFDLIIGTSLDQNAWRAIWRESECWTLEMTLATFTRERIGAWELMVDCRYCTVGKNGKYCKQNVCTLNMAMYLNGNILTDLLWTLHYEFTMPKWCRLWKLTQCSNYCRVGKVKWLITFDTRQIIMVLLTLHYLTLASWSILYLKAAFQVNNKMDRGSKP